MTLGSLAVNLKTTTKTNQNCQHTRQRSPKRISTQSIDSASQLLSVIAREYHLQAVHINFHGGEPLLQGKSQYEYTCMKLCRDLQVYAKPSLAIQTNAVLIDEEWIKLFELFKVAVSVRLDQMDFQTTKSQNKTLQGIRRLQEGVKNRRLFPIRLVCQFNEKMKSKNIYRYFLEELQIKNMDFILPNIHHHVKQDEVAIYHDICELYHCWKKDQDPTIRIRVWSPSFLTELPDHFRSLFAGYPVREFVSISIDTKGSFATVRNSLFFDLVNQSLAA